MIIQRDQDGFMTENVIQLHYVFKQNIFAVYSYMNVISRRKSHCPCQDLLKGSLHFPVDAPGVPERTQQLTEDLRSCSFRLL